MAITRLNNNSLTSITALPSGVGGKLGQIVTTSFTLDQDRSETSLTELNSSCRVTITPSATSSKILYLISFPFRAPSSNNGFFINIFKSVGGASYADDSGELSRYAGYGGAGTGGEYRTFSTQYLDSPNTTSAIIFTPYIKVSSSTINFGNNGKFNATVMEIK